MRKFRKKYKQIKTYAPYAYDATNLIIQAIKASGDPGNRAKVLAGIRQAGDFEGVTGKTSFDAQGDNQNKEIYFYIVRKKMFNWYQTNRKL